MNEIDFNINEEQQKRLLNLLKEQFSEHLIKYHFENIEGCTIVKCIHMQGDKFDINNAKKSIERFLFAEASKTNDFDKFKSDLNKLKQILDIKKGLPDFLVLIKNTLPFFIEVKWNDSKLRNEQKEVIEKIEKEYNFKVHIARVNDGLNITIPKSFQLQRYNLDENQKINDFANI